MNKEQLELTLEAALLSGHAHPRRGRRPGRARWWFEQMHAAVNRAFDWKPSPPARPEQGYFSLARGQGAE